MKAIASSNTTATNHTHPRVLERLAAAALCIALTLAVVICAAPADAHAAAEYTATKTNYVAGAGDGHLWAKDTIQYRYSNGRIVSKPTVQQQASAICKVQQGVRGPIYGCFFKYKAPTIRYSSNAKTATITTYWVCKEGLSAWKLNFSWHKTCAVTYTCSGNGRIAVSKKTGNLRLG